LNQRHGRSVEWYKQLFANEACINGDITPCLWNSAYRSDSRNLDLMPHLRLIYLIRNPIERAWSSARMALGRAEMQQEEASDQWFIDHFKSKGSLARGDYETCIRQWRNVYPF